MSKPLRFETKMDLVCRGLDFEANVTLDYFRGCAPVIRSRREDCEPGVASYCTVRGVEVLTDDPELPRFSPGELFAAAEKRAENDMENLAEIAEREGYVPAPVKPTESSLRIFSLPKPPPINDQPPQVLREPVGPSV